MIKFNYKFSTWTSKDETVKKWKETMEFTPATALWQMNQLTGFYGLKCTGLDRYEGIYSERDYQKDGVWYFKRLVLTVEEA